MNASQPIRGQESLYKLYNTNIEYTGNTNSICKVFFCNLHLHVSFYVNLIHGFHK